LFLSAATATRRTERTFLPKSGAPTIQVSQISFVFWFAKPVRLKRLARFCAFLAPTVLVERSTIRPGASRRRQVRGAGEGGLILMDRRSRQLKVGSARREARVLDGKVDEEALARLAGRIA
jgi:hypothetical protein